MRISIGSLEKLRPNPYWLLAGIFIFAIVVRLIYFVGVFRFDSFFYAQLSFFISQFDLHSFFFENNNYFAIDRLLLFIPAAIAYKFFGVNDFSSVWFVFLCSVANIGVIFLLGKKLINTKVGLIAAFLLAIYPLDVFYSTQFLPDGLIPFFHASAALMFLYGESEGNQKKALIFYFLSGVFIGLGQYVRENAFIFVIVILAYLLIKRRFSIKHTAVGFGGLGVFLLASTFFYAGTGDFFFQARQVLAMFLESEAISASQDKSRELFPFLKAYLFEPIFRPFNLIFFISSIYVFIYKRKEALFVLTWLLIFLFYLDFVSSSHNLGIRDRYLSIIVVPSLLIIATTLDTVFKRLGTRTIGIVLILVSLTLASKTALESVRPYTVKHKHFVRYKTLARELKNREPAVIYINNLDDKGYIFNYIFDFRTLDYNSFLRGDVKNTSSFLQEWDGVLIPEKGSYVVVDKDILEFKVQKNWKLITTSFNASLYLVD